MALKTLKMTRGDTNTITLTFKNAAGALYCIKNWAVIFTMKTVWSLPDAQASLQITATTHSDSTGGTTGVAVISIADTDTVNLDPGLYDYDISIRTAANETFTVAKGKMDLEHDVTRTPGTAGTAA